MNLFVFQRWCCKDDVINLFSYSPAKSKCSIQKTFWAALLTHSLNLASNCFDDAQIFAIISVIELAFAKGWHSLGFIVIHLIVVVKCLKVILSHFLRVFKFMKELKIGLLHMRYIFSNKLATYWFRIIRIHLLIN